MNCILRLNILSGQLKIYFNSLLIVNLIKKRKGVFYTNAEIRKIDENTKLVRLCLHTNENKNLMSMLILIREKYIYPTHKHVWKDEFYTILKGNCIYQEFDNSGKTKLSTTLHKGESLLNHNKSFHVLKPNTDLFCFIETTTGPFIKDAIEFLR